jgi:SAM-dependent methyltransferase
MMYTRYAVAAELAVGKRVLELACGGGNGFGLVAAQARSVVGGDFSAPLLRHARAHYGERVPLVRLTAEALPFRAGAFDVVLFFEASYYVPDMNRAFDEGTRVLPPGGTVLFVNANPERPDFITSPHSVRYHTADQFRTALERRGFRVTTEAAFPVQRESPGLVSRAAGSLVRAARVVLDTLGLVPQTLRGRARLKRLIFRDLATIPPEIPPSFSAVESRVAVAAGPVRHFKVIYIAGRRC